MFLVSVGNERVADVHFVLVEFVLYCLQFVVVFFFEAVHSGGVDVFNQRFALIFSGQIAEEENVSCHFSKIFDN